LSQTDDSFSEKIIFEATDDLPLSENDILQARQLRDHLKRKDEKLTEKIKATGLKIKQLWAKLNIEKVDTIELLMDGKNTVDGEQVRKSKIIEIVSLGSFL
jgi:hypothetical protein